LRTFSVLYAHSTFGHHPHPYITFVPNFVSFAASVAELAHEEKSCTQSLNHLLIQLICCPGNWSFTLEEASVSMTLE